MEIVKSIGGYDLVHSELDDSYEIYKGDEFIDSYPRNEEREAEEYLEFLATKGEVINNEKND